MGLLVVWCNFRCVASTRLVQTALCLADDWVMQHLQQLVLPNYSVANSTHTQLLYWRHWLHDTADNADEPHAADAATYLTYALSQPLELS